MKIFDRYTRHACDFKSFEACEEELEEEGYSIHEAESEHFSSYDGPY